MCSFLFDLCACFLFSFLLSLCCPPVSGTLGSAQLARLNSTRSHRPTTDEQETNTTTKDMSVCIHDRVTRVDGCGVRCGGLGFRLPRKFELELSSETKHYFEFNRPHFVERRYMITMRHTTNRQTPSHTTELRASNGYVLSYLHALPPL